MSKDLPYFSFTVATWLGDDISIQSYEAKGLFIDVCAYYWMKKRDVTLARLKARFSQAIGTLEKLIKDTLIKVNDDETVSISFLDEEYDRLVEKHENLRIAGQKGASKRYSHPIATPQPPHSNKIKEKNIKEKKKERRVFLKPNLLELDQYIKENNYNVNPEAFLNYYESNGWLIGKSRTPMKNWQAAVRTWHINNNKDTQINTGESTDLVISQTTKNNLEVGKRFLQSRGVQ